MFELYLTQLKRPTHENYFITIYLPKVLAADPYGFYGRGTEPIYSMGHFILIN